MRFSVIVPTYDDWNGLAKCLAGLENQTIESEQYQVIVVDNSESGIVPDDFNLPAGMQLIHEPEPGSYIARNRGAGLATGEILAFTDSDCIPDKDWLAKAENCFSQKNCELIGGAVQIFQSAKENKYGYLYESIAAFPQHKNVPVGKGVTANLFVKSSVFEAVSGFSTTVVAGGDWEFTRRCTKEGFKMIYCKSALVLHPARTLAGIFKKQQRMVCGGALSIKQKYGHSYLRMLASYLIHKPNFTSENNTRVLRRSEKALVFSIDMMKYFYGTVLLSGMLLGLIDPRKVRE